MTEEFKYVEPKKADISNMLSEKHDCPTPAINVINRQGSGLKILRGYAFLHCGMFVLGTVTLIGGSLAQFIVQGLIGVVVDAMAKNDWDTIN